MFENKYCFQNVILAIYLNIYCVTNTTDAANVSFVISFPLHPQKLDFFSITHLKTFFVL